MFQIAAAIGYARKHKDHYYIPMRTENERIWPMAFKRLGSPPQPLSDVRVWQEPDHGYTEIPFHRDTILSGYFQSEKYFSHARREVVAAFGIPYRKNEGVVSIHVRRGDYLQFPDKHPPVTMDYIAAAVEKFPGYKFLVFSDDLRWCRENFPKLGRDFDYQVGRSAIEDISAMSGCEHNIISNSTFSWWAGWLNNNPDKVVVSPSKDSWFGPGNKHLKTDDIIPDSWTQIPTK